MKGRKILSRSTKEIEKIESHALITATCINLAFIVYFFRSEGREIIANL